MIFHLMFYDRLTRVYSVHGPAILKRSETIAHFLKSSCSLAKKLANDSMVLGLGNTNEMCHWRSASP